MLVSIVACSVGHAAQWTVGMLPTQSSRFLARILARQSIYVSQRTNTRRRLRTHCDGDPATNFPKCVPQNARRLS